MKKTQKNDEKTEEVATKPEPRRSSEFVRVVGDTHIAVVNTKQNKVPKKATKKWAVICTTPTKSGGWKKTVHAVFDRKGPAIQSLRDHETALKAKAIAKKQ